MANFSMRQRKEDVSVITSGARSLKIDLRDQKQKKKNTYLRIMATYM